MKIFKDRIWIRLFASVSLIFIIFVAVLLFTNKELFYDYYLHTEKSNIISSANIIKQDFTNVNASDTASINGFMNNMRTLERKSSINITIYDSTQVYYTTMQSPGNAGIKPYTPSMLINPDVKLNVIQEDRDFVYYTYKINDTTYGDLKIQKDFIYRAADVSNQFVMIVLITCLVATLIWAYIYARKFAKPIVEMNDITRKMANLQFDNVLHNSSSDEIGELADSINILSEKLAATLKDINAKNASLKGEIERERALEVMRKEFIANVSHELKTPIAIIQGYAEVLSLSVNKTDSKAVTYTGVIMDETKRMNEMVLDLLELSQFELGQKKLSVEDFEVNVLTNSVLSKFSHKADEHDVKLINNVVINDIVSADYSQVERVLINFISNAFSHVTKNGEIIIDAKIVNQSVRISVFNSGAGIAPEDASSIWQSFYRADKSHKREAQRFGLGLSIVKAIQDLHGQEYGTENVEGGVEFYCDIALKGNLQIKLAPPVSNNLSKDVLDEHDENIKYQDI